MLKPTWTMCAALALLAWTNPVAAQQNSPAITSQTQSIKRTPLQRFDVPGTAYETVIGLAEIVPNVTIGKHTHPGNESGYIIEGELTLLVVGQPEKLVKTGESYQVLPSVVHDARTGERGAKVIATYVVEKGKPLASPAD